MIAIGISWSAIPRKSDDEISAPLGNLHDSKVITNPSHEIPKINHQNSDLSELNFPFPKFHIWLVVWNMFYFPIYFLDNHPN